MVGVLQGPYMEVRSRETFPLQGFGVVSVVYMMQAEWNSPLLKIRSPTGETRPGPVPKAQHKSTMQMLIYSTQNRHGGPVDCLPLTKTEANKSRIEASACTRRSI